ncbi:MAG: nitroreductase family protein [Anaerolineae bacterium]|nr:nitroreductase family protein [Anaerolineae bacterium]
MIVIDREQCTGCGSCVKICHESCLSLSDGVASIDYDYCSTCSQCVAICPERALSWDNVPPAAFDAARLPSPEQLDELFKQRRSIRLYKKDRIDRALLEEIVNYGIYAPTHNYSFRVIVVDKEEGIQTLDRILMRFISPLYNIAYRPKIVGTLAKLIGFSEEYLLNKPKVENAVKRGSAFRHPAAIVFIVGDKRIALSVDSAQYYLANMTFYAQVKGIASCLWGNGPIFMDKSRAARRLLGLQKHDRIFGSLLLGYPAVRFKNKVEGRTMPIQWLGG